MSTAPIFAPDGTLGDIPPESLSAAIKAGGKPGVNIIAPDGTKGVVPADRYVDAVKAGAKVAPFEDQGIQHPGFWANLGNDLKAMIPSGNTNDQSWKLGRVAAAEHARVQDNANQAAADEWRKQNGYSPAYRATAPIAEGLGANVRGMEESAQEGDVSGVLGHAAAVPAVMAATEGIARGVPAAITSDTGSAIIRNTARVTNKALAKAPTTIGAAAGAAAGAATHVPFGTEVGAGLGGAIGKEILPQIKIPGEHFNLPDTVEGGPKTAPDYVEPAKAASAAESVQPAEESSTPPSGAGIPRTLSGDSALRQILTGQDNANLLKIARSRGINVTQEAQLKPAVADSRIINKIIDDFEPDELQEIRDQYLENTRFRHTFGNVGPEAWKTMSLQTYFPDLKIPQAVINRTQAAIAGVEAPKTPVMQKAEALQQFIQPKASAKAAAAVSAPDAPGDLTEMLKQSLAKVKKKKLSDLQ